MTYLQRQARGAAERIIQLSKTAESESVKLNANQDILDRTGIREYEPEEKKPSPTSIQINIIIPDGIDAREPVPFARGHTEAIPRVSGNKYLGRRCCFFRR